MIRHPRTASVVLGGGTPKNFINQASVQAEFFDDRIGGHRYALQIVTDVPHFGGASGSSLEEARSWGKLATDAEQVTVHADATIALPLLVSALAGSAREHARRPEAAVLRSVRSDDGRQRPAFSARAFRGPLVMDVPFEYDHAEPLVFGGALPVRRSFDESSVVILPVPVDRTTSYVGGTRNGPHEILQASSHMELWDEEMQADVHGVGIFTLPEMELPFGEMAAAASTRSSASPTKSSAATSSWSSLGGEHSITPPLVSAAARKYPGLSVLQIDAHADMRDSYMGTRHNHACAMRRSLQLRAR